MRYLGIDYGSKRIGLALSDEEGRLAFPYRTVPNTKTLFAEIAAVIKQEGAGRIVVGLPVPFSGGESEQTREVKKFIEKLKKLSEVRVDTENEIFTTKIAKRGGVSERHLDSASAALILQSYLDKMSR
ncbi:MAG: Holliday junction resolvase RuvX [Candidatus Sungiibacteriota bacterium]